MLSRKSDWGIRESLLSFTKDKKLNDRLDGPGASRCKVE